MYKLAELLPQNPKIKEQKMQLAEPKAGKLHIFLCEDHPIELEQLQQDIYQVAKENQWDISCSSFSTADALLDVLEQGKAENKPDVIFTDIEMPGANGIDLGKKIYSSYPDIYLIFTTCHEEYAILGYETRAYRYLLKPITSQIIKQTLDQIFLERGKNKCLILKKDGNEMVIPLKEIVYINAEDKYTIFHTTETSYFDRVSLQECEEKLEKYGFYRIHRKYLVNMRHHKGLQKGNVIVSGNLKLPISRRKEETYQKQFMELLEQGMLE